MSTLQGSSNNKVFHMQERLRQQRGSTNMKEIYSRDGHITTYNGNNNNNFFPDAYGTRSKYMFDFYPSLESSLNH